MHSRRSRYLRHRFPPDIISHAVWLYHRYGLSFRDVEDLLAERGVIVSYETVRQWCGKFGPDYARRLKRRQGRLGDTWFLDEVFITMNGQRQYLWRAVDQDGDLIDLLVQPRRGIVKLTKTRLIDPQDDGLEPVVNRVCRGSVSPISLNLTIPSTMRFS